MQVNWKEPFQKLENTQQWDAAIDLMQEIIADNTSDIDAYIAMIYLLMNLLVEEDHDESKHDYYEALLKHYFDISYAKFTEVPEYLFFIGIVAHMSEWYLGIDIEEAKDMLKKARDKENENALYNWGYYVYLDTSNEENQKLAEPFASQVLNGEQPYHNFLISKGSVGEYISEIMRNWLNNSKIR